MITRLVATALAAVVMLSAVGCAGIDRVATRDLGGVAGAATIATPDAQVAGELAPGLPEGLPLWPGATVKRAQASGQLYDLTLVANAPYPDVLAGVAAGFEQAGWEVAQEQADNLDATSTVLTLAGPTTEGILTVTEESTGTVSLVYMLAPTE